MAHRDTVERREERGAYLAWREDRDAKEIKVGVGSVERCEERCIEV
jgi:hypothetical protein